MCMFGGDPCTLWVQIALGMHCLFLVEHTVFMWDEKDFSLNSV